MLECVVNISEGRDRAVMSALAKRAGRCLLDFHADADHHRSVLTLAGADVEQAVRNVATEAVSMVDIRRHSGVHPRFGVVDVVPFIGLDHEGTPLPGSEGMSAALTARDSFATWAGEALGLPCFLFGPERSLPDIRRSAFETLMPDTGPKSPHPSAGACAVGARSPLVAYNIWLDNEDLQIARDVAREVRSASVRTLGMAVGGATQVSCNLLDPASVGPADVYDAVADAARKRGVALLRGELVGLAPAAVVASVAADRYRQLDIGPDRTIEARLLEIRGN